MIEKYMCQLCENPSFMLNIFERKELIYSIRSDSLLVLGQAITAYGTDLLAFKKGVLWTVYLKVHNLLQDLEDR